MARVRVGYLPTGFGSSASHGTRRLVELTDAAGLDHLAVGDHVSFFGGLGFDGLLSASAVLACSDRLATNTGVYLLPLRHPVLVASQLADLALVAPGRFTFGVGIGGEDPHEVEVCGVDPKTRGRRMDECIHIVRGLLSGAAVDHDSEFFDLADARIVPSPATPIPIVVGGRSDAAISRAGRLGDGWFGIWVSASRYAQVVAQVQEIAAASERADVPSQHALNVWCGVGSTTDEARAHVAPAMEAFYQLPYERFERWSPAGTPEQIADFLIPYAEAGCSTFNLILNGAGPDAEIAAAADIRERILAGAG